VSSRVKISFHLLHIQMAVVFPSPLQANNRKTSQFTTSTFRILSNSLFTVFLHFVSTDCELMAASKLDHKQYFSSSNFFYVLILGTECYWLRLITLSGASTQTHTHTHTHRHTHRHSVELLWTRDWSVAEVCTYTTHRI
jgi:hypothetical protein